MKHISPRTLRPCEGSWTMEEPRFWSALVAFSLFLAKYLLTAGTRHKATRAPCSVLRAIVRSSVPFHTATRALIDQCFLISGQSRVGSGDLWAYQSIVEDCTWDRASFNVPLHGGHSNFSPGAAFDVSRSQVLHHST